MSDESVRVTVAIEEENAGTRHLLLREAVALEIDYFRNILAKRNGLRDMARKEFNGLPGAD